MVEIEKSHQSLKLNTESQEKSLKPDPEQEQASPSSSDSALANSIVDNNAGSGFSHRGSGDNAATSFRCLSPQEKQTQQNTRNRRRVSECAEIVFDAEDEEISCVTVEKQAQKITRNRSRVSECAEIVFEGEEISCVTVEKQAAKITRSRSRMSECADIIFADQEELVNVTVEKEVRKITRSRSRMSECAEMIFGTVTEDVAVSADKQIEKNTRARNRVSECADIIFGTSVPEEITKPKEINKYVRTRRRSSNNQVVHTGHSVDSAGVAMSKGSPELINPDEVDAELDALAYGTRTRKLSASITEGMYVVYPDDDINGCNQAMQAGKPVGTTRKGSLCDRKKRSTVSLSVTKNGGGGKFTWGRPGDEWKSSCPSGVRDEKDPNFDDFDDNDSNTFYQKCGQFYSDDNIIDALHSLFKDFLTNGDDKELLDTILEMQNNQVNCNVLSRIFFYITTWGLEANRKNRGHVWALFSKLFSKESGFSEDLKYAQPALEKSFENFVDARTMLKIDCPDYDEYIQKLIACFVYKFNGEVGCSFFDEYLDEQVSKRQIKFNQMIKSARSIANRLKSDFQIMATIWTCDDYLTTEQLSLAMSKLVDDWMIDGYSYISLADELKECFKTPNFYHELVYLLLMKTVEKSTREVLQYCVQTLEYLVIHRKLIHKNQMKIAFMRFYKQLDELAVDIPAVHNFASILVKHCYEKRLIDDEVRVKLPKRKGDRRRIRSEATVSHGAYRNYSFRQQDFPTL